MINSVNSLPMVQNVNVQGTNNKNVQIENNTPKQVPDANLNGTNALASYNVGLISKPEKKPLEPALPTVLQPEAIHSMGGDRIYSSTGTLNTIVKKGSDNTTAVFTMDPAAPNDAISKIEFFDQETGKLVRVQYNHNEIKEGQMPVMKAIEIFDYTPDGKIGTGTVYQDGKPYSVWKNETALDGTQMSSIYNYADKTSTVIETNPNGDIGRQIKYDENGKVVSITTRDFKNFEKQTTSFRDGTIIKNETIKKNPIPNKTGKDPLNDKDLVPAKPYILGYNPQEVQGEKLYYSNGVLEKIITNTAEGEVIHDFDCKGNLKSISTPDGKTIMYTTGDNLKTYYTVEEKLPDGATKKTDFSEDGLSSVSIISADEKQEKYVGFSKDEKMTTYYEINKDGERVHMDFDENGNLMSADLQG